MSIERVGTYQSELEDSGDAAVDSEAKDVYG